MPTFSKRYGYKQMSHVIQHESADQNLRLSVWNYFNNLVWCRWSKGASAGNKTESEWLMRFLWTEHLKWDADDLKPSTFSLDDSQPGYTRLKKHVMECEWFEFYDLLEFICQKTTYGGAGHADQINKLLEREGGAYRILGKYVTPIIETNEIKAVDEAVSIAADPVRIHLEAALGLLSDRTTPDFRNSIKESISAVESVVRLNTGESSVGISNALKKLPGLHPALREALSKLYGFTSDSDGIRHALMDEPTVTYEDAKFMLVVCSAFTSYLRTKMPLLV